MKYKANLSGAKETTAAVAESLRKCSELIGERNNKSNTFSFVPGAGLPSWGKAFTSKASEYEQGVYQVLFMGQFNSGKSTAINAMLEKDLLRSSIKAETAVLTKIVYGEEEEFIVYYKDDTPPKRYTQKEFYEFFRVSQTEPDKFINVDHVIAEQKGPLFEDLIQLIDTPGLGNSPEDSRIVHDYFDNADAVVYAANGASGAWTQEDKVFLNEHFKGHHLRNLFFIVTHTDLLKNDQYDDIVEQTKIILHDVFIDKEGNFDEDLYSKRVFFVDFYGALHNRLGEKIEIQRSVFVDPPKIEATGIIPFEESVYEFLSSADKYKATFEGYLSRMATGFVQMKAAISDSLSKYSDDEKILNTQKADIERDIEILNNTIDAIESCFKNAVRNIMFDIKQEYATFLDSVEIDWDDYFTNSEVTLKFGNVVGLAWNVIMSGNKDINDLPLEKQTKIKDKIKPITDEVEKFLNMKGEEFKQKLDLSIKVTTKKLEDDLALYNKQLESIESIDIDEIIELLKSAGKAPKNISGDEKVNYTTLILSALGGDFDHILENPTGESNIGQGIANLIGRLVVEVVVANLLFWLTGIGLFYWVFRAVWALLKINKGASNMTGKILNGTKEATIKEIKDRKREIVGDTERNLNSIFLHGSASELLTSMSDQLNDSHARLEDIINLINSKSYDASKEAERTNNVIKEYCACFNEYCNAIGISDMSELQIENYAITKTEQKIINI